MTRLYYSYRSMLTSAWNYPFGPPVPVHVRWKVELFVLAHGATLGAVLAAILALAGYLVKGGGGK